jgi:hypothetical protein
MGRVFFAVQTTSISNGRADGRAGGRTRRRSDVKVLRLNVSWYYKLQYTLKM